MWLSGKNAKVIYKWFLDIPDENIKYVVCI